MKTDPGYRLPPEVQAKDLRLMRADDVSTLKGIAQLGRTVRVWGSIVASIIGSAIALGVWYGGLAKKDQVVPVATFTEYQASEDARWNRIDPKIDQLNKSIQDLSQSVAVLAAQIADGQERRRP